jgi:2-dehydropantoate 2-reductase
LVQAGRSRLNRLPVRFSTWQSIARGRPSEIDYLNGEIVRLGVRLGVPTPYNGRLVRLIHRVEQTGAFYPVEQVGAFYRDDDPVAGEAGLDAEPLAGGVR